LEADHSTQARASAPTNKRLDEGVLHRCIGGPKVMRDQLVHLADMAGNPLTTIQVIPASVGAHAGLLGGFVIAELDGSPGMVYLETAAEGQIADSPRMAFQADPLPDIDRARRARIDTGTQPARSGRPAS
jgi:hypothetical protein